MRFLVITCMILGVASALPAKVKRDAPYPAAVPVAVPHETYGPPLEMAVEHTEDCVADGRWIDDVAGRKWSVDDTPDTVHVPVTHSHTESEGNWKDDVTGRKWNLDETPELTKIPENHFVPVTHAPETHTHAPHTHTGNELEGKWIDDVTGRKWNLDDTLDVELTKTPETPYEHTKDSEVIYNTEHLRHELAHVKYDTYPAAAPHDTHGVPLEKQTTTHDENCEADGRWINDVVDHKWNVDDRPEPEKPDTKMYDVEIKYAPEVKYTPYPTAIAPPETAYAVPEQPDTKMYEVEIKYAPYAPAVVVPPQQLHEEYGTPEVKYAPYPAAVPLVKENTEHDENCEADGRWIDDVTARKWNVDETPETPYIPVPPTPETHTHEPTKETDGKWKDDVTGRKWNIDDAEPTRPHTPEPEKPHTKMYEMEINYAPYAPAVPISPPKPHEEVKFAPYPTAVPLAKEVEHDENCKADGRWIDDVTARKWNVDETPETPYIPVPPTPETHTHEPTKETEGKWKDDVTGRKWNIDDAEPTRPHAREPEKPHTKMYEMEINYAPYAPAVPIAPPKPHEDYGPPEVKFAPYPAAVPLVKEVEHDKNCEADGRWIDDVTARKWNVDETPETHNIPVPPTPETQTHEPTKETDGKWKDDVTGRKWNIGDAEPTRPHTPEPEKPHTKMYEMEINYAPYAPAVPIAPPKPHEEYGPPKVKFAPYPAALPLVKEVEHDENCEADGRWINDLGKNYDEGDRRYSL